MKKKLLSLVLAGAMVLSLTACGLQSAPAAEEAPAAAAEETKEEAPAAEEAAPAEEAPAAEAAE